MRKIQANAECKLKTSTIYNSAQLALRPHLLYSSSIIQVTPVCSATSFIQKYFSTKTIAHMTAYIHSRVHFPTLKDNLRAPSLPQPTLILSAKELFNHTRGGRTQSDIIRSLNLVSLHFLPIDCKWHSNFIHVPPLTGLRRSCWSRSPAALPEGRSLGSCSGTAPGKG